MTEPPPTGLVVVDKPSGLTSHDVVARLRRLAGTRKVGHAGTLDPMATGVLVVGLGRATRLLGHLQGEDKAYDATIRLGVTTTTDDADGEVLQLCDASAIGEERVGEGLAEMVGEIDQVPSSVSAIKVGGRRAYQRVRSGETVALEPRRVRIDAIEVQAVRETRHEGVAVLDADVSVRCTAGTYVRAIARDLGEALGVGGHLSALRRTAVGPFTLAGAHTLDELADDLHVHDLDRAARALFCCVDLDPAAAADVRFGRRLALMLPAPGPVALFSPEGRLLALYEQRGDHAAAIAVFAPAG